MPLSHFRCSLCGTRCPKKYLVHGQFANRMRWLMRHRKRKHPTVLRKSVRKSLATRLANY